jgi:hypothetical protein
MMVVGSHDSWSVIVPVAGTLVKAVVGPSAASVGVGVTVGAASVELCGIVKIADSVAVGVGAVVFRGGSLVSGSPGGGVVSGGRSVTVVLTGGGGGITMLSVGVVTGGVVTVSGGGVVTVSGGGTVVVGSGPTGVGVAAGVSGAVVTSGGISVVMLTNGSVVIGVGSGGNRLVTIETMGSNGLVGLESASAVVAGGVDTSAGTVTFSAGAGELVVAGVGWGAGASSAAEVGVEGLAAGSSAAELAVGTTIGMTTAVELDVATGSAVAEDDGAVTAALDSTMLAALLDCLSSGTPASLAVGVTTPVGASRMPVDDVDASGTVLSTDAADDSLLLSMLLVGRMTTSGTPPVDATAGAGAGSVGVTRTVLVGGTMMVLVST